MSSERWTASPETPPTDGNPSRPIDPKAVKIELKPVVTGLPFGWYVEYQGWAEVDGGMSFVILRPQIRWSYSDFVCLMGHSLPNVAANFRRVPVLGVTRWRDGGTTEIKTAEGSFMIPIEGRATFKDEEIMLYERFQGACG